MRRCRTPESRRGPGDGSRHHLTLCGSPGWRRVRAFLDDGISEGADAVDLHRYLIALPQEDGRIDPHSDATRCATDDHIARLQWTDRREVVDEVLDAEQQCVDRLLLPNLAVDLGGY